MNEGSGEFLTTGAAARLLGSSRQHVVDMCTRGELSFVWVGRHRRIQRVTVNRLLHDHRHQLTRDQERSLWLHRALLARLMSEPDQVLDLAARNVERLLALQSRDNMTVHWLREWSRVLAAGVDEVAEVLTSRSPLALELRQNSPFAGALAQQDRDRVLAAFVRHWKDAHVSQGSVPPARTPASQGLVDA